MQKWHTLPYKGKSYKIAIFRKDILCLNLKVATNGTVSLSAPYSVPQVQIVDFLQSKAKWIATNVAKMNEKIQICKVENLTLEGGKITFLGKDIAVDIKKAPTNQAKLNDNSIVLHIARYELEQAKKVLDIFLRQKLQTILANFISANVHKHKEFPKASITVKRMRSRWGSCNITKKIVALNSYLIYTPLSCIEYIIMHEFVHFLCSGHSVTFYEKLASYMPDWKQRKRLLDSYSII